MINVLVVWLVQGLAVAAVAALAMRFVPPASASARHALWWLALVGVVVLPWMPTPMVPFGMGPLAGVATVVADPLPLTLPPPHDGLLMAAALLWVSVVLVSALRLLTNLRVLRTLVRHSTQDVRATWRSTRVVADHPESGG